MVSRANQHDNTYNLANQPLRVAHIDAGVKYTVMDAAGKPIWLYDGYDPTPAISRGKGSEVYNNYDAISRPKHSFAQDGALEGFTKRSAIVYGDDANYGPANPDTTNHLGQPYKSYDEAGLVTILAYDFKGNPLAKTQQVIKDEKIVYEIENPGAGYSVSPYRTDWGSAPSNQEGTLLEGNYRTDTEYDALNRATKITLPEDINTDRKEIVPTYNRAGVAEKVTFDTTEYVTCTGSSIFRYLDLFYPISIVLISRMRTSTYHRSIACENNFIFNW